MSDPTAPHDAHGIWQVARTVAWPDAGARQVNGIDTFVHQDDTVTLRLLTLHPGSPGSDDDVYTLAARWDDDTLTYRPPFGEYQPLATFEDGHFVDIGNGTKRIFDRILPAEILSWNRPILSARAPHVYGRAR